MLIGETITIILIISLQTLHQLMFLHVPKIFLHEKFEFLKVSKVNFCVKQYNSYKRRSQDLASQLFITTVTQYL